MRIHLQSLDVLRVIAAFWILLFHLLPQITLLFGQLPVVTPILAHGYLGVDLFFALSGFVIYYNYRDRLYPFHWPEYRHFLLKRLIRVYPLHLVILLAIAVFVLSAPHLGVAINNPQDYTWPKFIAQFFLVSAWSFPARMSWNFFSWAISALWLMYLLTPLFITVIKKSPPAVLIFLSAILIILTPILMSIFPFPSKVAYALPRALAGFGIGMILCRVFKRKLIAQNTSSIWTKAAQFTYALYMLQYPVLLFYRKLLPPGASLTLEIATLTSCALLGFILIERAAYRFGDKIMRFWAWRSDG